MIGVDGEEEEEEEEREAEEDKEAELREDDEIDPGVVSPRKPKWAVFVVAPRDPSREYVETINIPPDTKIATRGRQG